MEQEIEILGIANGIEGELESIEKGSEYCCSRCLVLEERSIGLESDLESKRNDIEHLHRQIVVLQVQNDVLKSFPKGSDVKSSQITNGDWDVEGEGDYKGGVDLMEEVENDKVLDCEKKEVESDVGFLKAKCEELELRVRDLENQLSSSTSGTANVVVNPVIKTEVVKEDEATPLIHTSNENTMQVNTATGEILHEKRNGHCSRTRKQLNFDEETRDKMAPATPAAGVISIKRKRASRIVKWKSQDDMEAAFEKDHVICMMAVCALYRQQTPDEKLCRTTIHRNYRGFSQDDAERGSILGEFLTEGDPDGGLNKSVEELKKFQPEGLEVCKTLAIYYSRQLFEMYENEEDPLWP